MIRLREIRRKCSNRTRQLHVPSGSSNRVIGPLCDIPIFREKGTTNSLHSVGFAASYICDPMR